MSAPKTVVTRRIPEPAVELLRGAGDVWVSPDDRPLSPDELRQAVSGSDAIVTLLHDRVDARVLDAAGAGLRIVANVAVGYDNVDVAAAAERGVVVTNTPGVLTDATADLAMALILALTRRLGEGERLLRAGRPWSWHMSFLLGISLAGKTLGIVGPGQIGRATARRAQAFGMEVVYAGRTGGLEELLATADVVSLHVPLTPATHHLINAERLRRMRPSACLINTARGPIVDEAALVRALEDGVIAGAALDVFEHEPNVHPGLLKLENVVLTPHLGSATIETRTAMAELAARNVVSVLTGGPPLTPVEETPT